MLTLAIVTSTPQVSVTVGRPGEPVASLSVRGGRRHAEALVPAIRYCTDLAGVGLHDLERVAVDIGPGLFTGLRVGVATAKALASALALPVVPCSSLDLLAHPHRLDGRPVASVIDARRGEVFWAVYRPSEGQMVSVTAPAVSTPAEAAGALDGPVLVTGDGARRYAGEFGAFPLAAPEHDHPAAVALLDLSSTRPIVATDQVTPDYIRGADVRIGWEKRDE